MTNIAQTIIILLGFIAIWVLLYKLLSPWISQIRLIYKPNYSLKVAFFTKKWPIASAKILDTKDGTGLENLSPRIDPFKNVTRVAVAIEYQDIYTNEKMLTWVYAHGKAKGGDIVKIKVNPAEASEAFII